MFDPAQPANHSALSSAVMRSQLTSLKTLIDAIQSIIAAVVDGVITLPPGDPATAFASIIGNELHLSFGIPQGSPGAQGIPGNDGGPGPQGPPFAQAVIDAVITLAPGTPAYVTVNFDGTVVHFTFGIPTGPQGPAGADGAPGEVTTAQLNTAIATTAQNPSGVAPLAGMADASYNQGQIQQVMDKLDELINATKRP